MSARYSNSPVLKLELSESRQRAVLYGALCLITVFALYLLCSRGYVFLAVPLGIIATYLLWVMRRDPMVGAKLCWRRGIWTIEQGNVAKEILPTGRSAVTPWLIYLAFTYLPHGADGHIWLYADSACANQLRRLRVRLTLLR